jgi:hypothetical protein
MVNISYIKIIKDKFKKTLETSSVFLLEINFKNHNLLLHEKNLYYLA